MQPTRLEASIGGTSDHVWVLTRASYSLVMASCHSENLEVRAKDVCSSGMVLVEIKQVQDGYGMMPSVRTQGREEFV